MTRFVKSEIHSFERHTLPAAGFVKHMMKWQNVVSGLQMWKHCFPPVNNTWACVKLFELRGAESRWAHTAVWNIPKQIYYKPYWSIPKDGHLGAVWCVSALQSENGISHEKLNAAKPAKWFHLLLFHWWKTSLSVWYAVQLRTNETVIPLLHLLSR